MSSSLTSRRDAERLVSLILELVCLQALLALIRHNIGRNLKQIPTSAKLGATELLWGTDIDTKWLTSTPLVTFAKDFLSAEDRNGVDVDSLVAASTKTAESAAAADKSASESKSAGSSSNSSSAADDGKFDVLLGADLTYEFESLPPLLATMHTLSRPGTIMLLAYGRERAAVPCFFELAAAHWTIEHLDEKLVAPLRKDIDSPTQVLTGCKLRCC